MVPTLLPVPPPPHVNSAMIMWGEGIQNLEWDLGMEWGMGIRALGGALGEGDQGPMGWGAAGAIGKVARLDPTLHMN